MKAVKGNKEYTIDETMQKSYQESGFDIFDADGEVVAYGRGKTVPYDEHMKAVREICRLQARVAELHTENEELKLCYEQNGKQPPGTDMEIKVPVPEADPGKKEKAVSKKAGE